MTDKNAGIEYDREVFAPSADSSSSGNPSLRGIFILFASLVAIVALGFLGYKIIAQGEISGSIGDSRLLGQLDQRLSTIEQRLEQLEKENHRRSLVVPAPTPKTDPPPASNGSSTAAQPKYRV